MTISVTQISNTQTFGAWLSTTNRLVDIVTQNTVTSDATSGGSVTTGNSFVNGHFGSNFLYVANTLSGGNVSSNGVLRIQANVAVFSGSSNLLVVTANGTTTAVSLSSNTISLAGQNNVAISGSLLSISSTNVALTGTSTNISGSLNIGNTTANVVISGAALTINGTNVNTAITGNAATAYTNAVSFATSASATAYSNAAAVATTAYSNAVAFASNASNISSGTLDTGRLSGTYSITANNANNLNGQAASYYTDIPARLGYTPVNRAGDTSMTGDFSTNGAIITVGRGEAELKKLGLENSYGLVYFYLNNSTGAHGLIDNEVVGIYGGVRYYSDTSANFYSINNITAYASDIRLKENLRPISESPLESLKQINGYRFEWRQDTKQPMQGTDVGLIAQEVEKVLPEAITQAPFDNEYKTIKMNQQVIALLVEAVKELTTKVEKMEQQLRGK